MEKNNAQEEIIHTVNGQLLVVACPGSGKTTTLLRRIHYMINEAKIPAQQILMVTFSSAAAKEMKTRYQKKFGMDAVTFSTIHSMCMSILKKFGGYTKESILSDPREYFYEVLRKQKGINDINEFIANKHLDNKSSDARRDLSRVLNHPNRYLFGYDYIVHGLNRRAMKATVYAKEKEPWKLNAAEGNIDLFFMLLKNLRGKKPSDFLRSLYSIGKYKKYLEDYADFRNMEVRDLSSIWKEYQHDASTYNDWVEWGKYIVKYNKELKETLKNKDGIMLSTMHGSKGLEWKHVFIIDCVEGVCPSPKAETAEELEEERRLFYVAMTRAKEHLYLCYYKAEEGKTVVASPYIM